MRPTAWQWDLRRRLLDLGVLVAAAIAAIILLSLGAPPLAWVVSLGPILIVFVSLAFAVNRRYLRAVDEENKAGYSTVYDFAGYELRDGRTLEVLRAGDVEPDRPGRRSLLAGMLQTVRRQ